MSAIFRIGATHKQRGRQTRMPVCRKRKNKARSPRLLRFFDLAGFWCDNRQPLFGNPALSRMLSGGIAQRFRLKAKSVSFQRSGA
jgi:hypothetical protein